MNGPRRSNGRKSKRSILAILCILLAVGACVDGAPTSPSPSGVALDLQFPTLPRRARTDATLDSLFGQMTPISASIIDPQLSLDGAEGPLINSWRTTMGFAENRVWALAEMNYWATDAEQSISLTISNQEGTTVGNDEQTTSDSEIFPWTRDLDTSIGLTVSTTCGLVANASSQHAAWQKVWAPVLGGYEFQRVQKASFQGGQQPACTEAGSETGGGGGGGNPNEGAYQVCIWRITFDEHGIISEELLGCHLTNSPYDLAPAVG